jgi:hypothetical protein
LTKISKLGDPLERLKEGVSFELFEELLKNRVCGRGYRNHTQMEGQKASSTEKSRFQSHIKHIFGFMEMYMNEMYITQHRH